MSKVPSMYEVEILKEWVTGGGEISSKWAKKIYMDVMMKIEWEKCCRMFDSAYKRWKMGSTGDSGYDYMWRMRDKLRIYDQLGSYEERVKKYMYDEKIMDCDGAYRVLHKYGRHKYVNCEENDVDAGLHGFSYVWVHDPENSYLKLKKEGKFEYDFYKNRVEWFVKTMEEIMERENSEVKKSKKWRMEIEHDGKSMDRYYREMSLHFKLIDDSHRIMIPFKMVVRKLSVNLFDALGEEICYYYDNKYLKRNIESSFLNNCLRRFDFRI